MNALINCPHCKAAIAADIDSIGTSVACGKCAQKFTVLGSLQTPTDAILGASLKELRDQNEFLIEQNELLKVAAKQNKDQSEVLDKIHVTLKIITLIAGVIAFLVLVLLICGITIYPRH